jgi:hypothetical protein
MTEPMRPTTAILIFALAIACDATTETKTTETKTTETKTTEAKPVEAKVREAKVVEGKVPEAKVVEAKAPEPAVPAKPVIPATRPKTLAEARDHLVAIAANDQLGALAKLVDGTALETTYQHESKGKKKKASLSTADEAKLAAGFRGEEWKPIHYVGALADDYDPKLAERLVLDEKASTIRYEPDGAFTVTFRFAKKGEELVLVGIDTYDEEP